jgi:hypothetical protein
MERGYGIIWYNDPAEDMTAILMNQGGAGRPTSPVSSTSSRPPTRRSTTDHGWRIQVVVLMEVGLSNYE